MSTAGNANAWAYACRVFRQPGPIVEAVLSDSDRPNHAALLKLKAVTLIPSDIRYALCPYCQLLRGQVFKDQDDLICSCPDCGNVRLAESDLRTWTFNSDWLTKQLRLSMDIPAQKATLKINDDLWRLGYRDGHTIILARSLEFVTRNPKEWGRACAGGKDTPWLITPKAQREYDLSDHDFDWIPMEERFTLYGGALQFVEPGKIIANDEDEMEKFHGPFSKDFHWVYLDDWPHGQIALSDAQTSVFKALWHFKGVPQTAEIIMNKAGLDSTKPIDVFKVKKQNKGESKYEGPYQAYRKLVLTDRRAGTYVIT